MSESEPFVSKRLEDVWAWKDAIYIEVAHLSTEQALSAIGEKAHIASQKYNLPRCDSFHLGIRNLAAK